MPTEQTKSTLYVSTKTLFHKYCPDKAQVKKNNRIRITNMYRIFGICISIFALLLNAGCGGGNPTPAPSSTGAATTPQILLPDGIPTPPNTSTPTGYEEFKGVDGSKVQVWSFGDRHIGESDLMYAGSLGLMITTELTTGELVAIVLIATVVYYVFITAIGVEPPTIYIPQVTAAPVAPLELVLTHESLQLLMAEGGYTLRGKNGTVINIVTTVDTANGCRMQGFIDLKWDGMKKDEGLIWHEETMEGPCDPNSTYNFLDDLLEKAKNLKDGKLPDTLTNAILDLLDIMAIFAGG